MNQPIHLHVWGDLACFTRPEMKVERVSYQVITPSAARGLLEITTIFHVETADDLRVWYPPTAELVKTTPDSEA